MGKIPHLSLVASHSWLMGKNPIPSSYPSFNSSMTHKGQLISKCLFAIFNSSKKRLKKFDLPTILRQVELFLFVFLEELKTPKRHLEINWPLVLSRNGHMGKEWPKTGDVIYGPPTLPTYLVGSKCLLIC